MAEIGRARHRIEDDRLLRGQGRFLADLRLPGALEVVFLRSVHAHAAIRRIDVASAASAPGIAAIFTAADVVGRTEPLSIGGQMHTPEIIERTLKPLDRLHPIPLLPASTVTYAGQAVAMVVAESRYAALDALELIDVEYAPLPAVLDPQAARVPGAPLVEPAWGSNLAVSLKASKGDPDAAFARAAVVVEDEFHIHRHVASPLETRGIAAIPDPLGRGLTLWAGTQAPHILRDLAAHSLRLPRERVRVVASDVGGGFGQKSVQYVEDMLVGFAALALGRPLRWLEERGENLVAAAHARDQTHRISVAATADGRILGVRDAALLNLGAFNVLGLVIPYNTMSHLLGPYDVPHATIAVEGVLTNTGVTAPYRGAGRPEAVFAMERIIDRLAARLDLEPAELRARNLIPAAAMPYDTGLLYSDGARQIYDSGDFPALLRRARDLVGCDEVRARQRKRRADDIVGVGFAIYVEGTGRGPFEGAVVRVGEAGRVEVATGACSQGQGHATVFAQIAADALGVAFEMVDVLGGDTDTVPFGIGTIGSRSTVVAGNAIHRAATALRARVLVRAEALLEASASDLEIVGGNVRVKGVPGPGMSLGEVVRAEAAAVLRRGEPGDGRLAETAFFLPPTVTYASAAHAAVVVLDAATGTVRVERYVVVHDCGRVVNPLLAEAQIAGAVAQGVGGALAEEFVYDERGQPLSGSFMDYALPRAADVPVLVTEHLESPSLRNPLGVKGLGEGGTIGAPAAIANAVEDAMKPYGAVVRRGPLTPERVRALIAASAR